MPCQMGIMLQKSCKTLVWVAVTGDNLKLISESGINGELGVAIYDLSTYDFLISSTE